MGKKLVIKGADFSANAVETDYSWNTVLEGSLTRNEQSDSTIVINLDENLPEGTVTRLTQQVTGSGQIAIGAVDTDNISHNMFWHNIIGSSSGEVIDVKTLSFDMKQLSIWIGTVGTTATYKLEVGSV